MENYRSIKLGLLLDRIQGSENAFQGEEDIYGFRVNYLFQGLKLSASFRAELDTMDIERIVKLINQDVELGKFGFEGQEIIFYDFFVQFNPGKQDSYWIYVLSQTQKFSKTLKKYLNAFKYFNVVGFKKILTVSRGIEKLRKSKYVSVIEYNVNERKNFDSDLQIISRLMEHNLNQIIIPSGSMIRPCRRIKYYCENYHLALFFSNCSLTSQNELNLLNDTLQKLLDSDFNIIDMKRFRNCACLINNQVYIIPDCHLSKLFQISTQKKLAKTIKNDKESVSSKLSSFADTKLLQNNNIFKLYDIDKNKEQEISTIYKEINRYNHDLIVQFYGTFSEISKTYIVFENHCVGNLSKALGRYPRSKEMKIFSNIILKLIEFMDWIKDKPISKYFLFSSSNLSYLDSKLKIYPNLTSDVIDYSFYPPEELLLVVLYKNPDYTRLLLQLFRYSKDITEKGGSLKLLGRALSLEFSKSIWFSSSILFKIKPEVKSLSKEELNRLKIGISKQFDLIFFQIYREYDPSTSRFYKVLVRFYIMLKAKEIVHSYFLSNDLNKNEEKKSRSDSSNSTKMLAQSQKYISHTFKNPEILGRSTAFTEPNSFALEKNTLNEILVHSETMVKSFNEKHDKNEDGNTSRKQPKQDKY